MQPAENIGQRETIELLNKCWMTHDGMWFFHCLQAFGIEATNRINKSAIESLSAIEIGRVKKAVGIDGPITNFDEFKALFSEASKLMTPSFMNVAFDFAGENKLKWKFKQGKCFAYKGITMIGAIEKYECGVLYRIKCWLDALSIKHRFNPGIGLCAMHHTGDCSGEIDLFI